MEFHVLRPSKFKKKKYKENLRESVLGLCAFKDTSMEI